MKKKLPGRSGEIKFEDWLETNTAHAKALLPLTKKQIMRIALAMQWQCERQRKVIAILESGHTKMVEDYDEIMAVTPDLMKIARNDGSTSERTRLKPQTDAAANLTKNLAKGAPAGAQENKHKAKIRHKAFLDYAVSWYLKYPASKQLACTIAVQEEFSKPSRIRDFGKAPRQSQIERATVGAKNEALRRLEEKK